MSDDFINLDVLGVDELLKHLESIPRDMQSYMQAAAAESLRVVLNTRGIRSYPPETAANKPPVPYYIRGRGMQVSQNRNLGNSERYGTKWNAVKTPYGAKAGNSVSYARKLASDDQLPHLGRIGWRKLSDVATEKLPEIKEIFQGWVNKLLKDLRLQ